MDWKEFSRARLPKFLDENGDLAPPWEQFPCYERYTIGWRMGEGEDWMCLWQVFLEGLGFAPDVRIAYLRRHPPAPVTWADLVHDVLHPTPSGRGRARDEKGVAERTDALLRAGLIAFDAAYPTWLSQQQSTVRWPWETARTPEEAARYGTRAFWFWSRQVDHLRRSDPAWTLPAIPQPWRPCAAPLRTGEVRSPDLDLNRGLLSLAQMLAAGRVTPPWQLGLAIDDFADSFANDMKFVDAFRLWGMSAFDDREQLTQYLAATNAPEAWRRWCVAQFV